MWGKWPYDAAFTTWASMCWTLLPVLQAFSTSLHSALCTQRSTHGSLTLWPQQGTGGRKGREVSSLLPCPWSLAWPPTTGANLLSSGSLHSALSGSGAGNHSSLWLRGGNTCCTIASTNLCGFSTSCPHLCKQILYSTLLEFPCYEYAICFLLGPWLTQSLWACPNPWPGSTFSSHCFVMWPLGKLCFFPQKRMFNSGSFLNPAVLTIGVGRAVGLGSRGGSTRFLQFWFRFATREGSGSAGTLLTNCSSQGHTVIMFSVTTWPNLIWTKIFLLLLGCGPGLQNSVSSLLYLKSSD